MDISRSLNPNNPKQAKIFFDYIIAHSHGEHRHFYDVMDDLMVNNKFKIICVSPQAISDGINIWIEFESIPELPNYLSFSPWQDFCV